MELETKSFGSIILNSCGSDVYPSPVSSSKQVWNNCKNLGIIIFFWSIPAANVLNPWIPEANVYTLISPAVYDMDLVLKIFPPAICCKAETSKPADEYK